MTEQTEHTNNELERFNKMLKIGVSSASRSALLQVMSLLVQKCEKPVDFVEVGVFYDYMNTIIDDLSTFDECAEAFTEITEEDLTAVTIGEAKARSLLKNTVLGELYIFSKHSSVFKDVSIDHIFDKQGDDKIMEVLESLHDSTTGDN